MVDSDNRAIFDRPNARIPRGTPVRERTAIEEVAADGVSCDLGCERGCWLVTGVSKSFLSCRSCSLGQRQMTDCHDHTTLLSDC